MKYPTTTDGRYFLVKGQLWRCSNPALSAEERKQLVSELMAARRAIKTAQPDSAEMQLARDAVHRAKVALGERGPTWWDDGAPDYNRTMVKNTPYADWAMKIGASGESTAGPHVQG